MCARCSCWRASRSAGAKDAETVLALRRGWRKASLTITEQRDPQNLNHPTDVARFQRADALFAADYVAAAHAPAAGKMNDMEPKFFAEFNTLVADTPIDQIKDLSALAPAARLCGHQHAGELRS
jgi:predicted metalloendopeptidase